MATNLGTSAIVSELLTKDNYANWSVCVKNYLLSQDLWDIVETESKPRENSAKFHAWRKKNATALHAIQISCGPDILSRIRKLSSAKEAWDSLDRMQKPQSQGVGGLTSHKQQSQGEIESGSKLDTPGTKTNEYDKNTPLWDAVDAGNWNVAKDFIDRYPNAVGERRTSDGNTALHVAAENGHVKIVEELVQLMPTQDLTIRNKSYRTALHNAVISRHVKVAEKLVQLMTEQDLEIQDYYGFTALHYIIFERDAKEEPVQLYQVAVLMVQKNKTLVSIPWNGLIPIVMASLKHYTDMVRYLYPLTPLQELTEEKETDGATILSYCIINTMFDVAWDLGHRCPRLAVALDRNGKSPLFVLSGMPSAFQSGIRLVCWQRWIYKYIHVQLTPVSSCVHIDIQRPDDGRTDQRNFVTSGMKHIYDSKLIHTQARELLRCICKTIAVLEEPELSKGLVIEAIFKAVKHRIVEFITEIYEASPYIPWKTDQDSRNIFQCAIIYRQKEIFKLIYGYSTIWKDIYISKMDRFDNNMLHLAAMLAPPNQLGQITGPALQLQRELLWFKEVEHLVQPNFRKRLNIDDKTPRELFTEQHMNLVKEGEEWMKNTATSCMVIATLMVTVMFAAAFTFPGGYNQETGYPFFLEKRLFPIFMAFDVLSFFASSTSALAFLGIFVSRYGAEYFLESLPTKMSIGLTMLIVSIISMMIAFSIALFLMIHGHLKWIFIPIILVASVPMIQVLFLQTTMLFEMFTSTFGPSIFNRKTRAWLK